jgi:hypothetical protein
MRSQKASPDWDLTKLNTFVAQEENFYRSPLVSIRAEGDTTILEFDDRAKDKPDTNAVITIGRPPPGATIIDNAKIFLGGSPVVVTAYRPAPTGEAR